MNQEIITLTTFLVGLALLLALPIVYNQYASIAILPGLAIMAIGARG